MSMVKNVSSCGFKRFEQLPGHLQKINSMQRFSYLSEVGARRLLDLGKKNILGHQTWENLMQSKRT